MSYNKYYKQYISKQHKRYVRNSYIISIILVVVLLVAFVVAIVGRNSGWRGVQRTLVTGNVAYLEKQRKLEQNSLVEIPGTLSIGPYRDLWKQWYTFLGKPSFLHFWLYNFTYDDAKRFFHEIALFGTKVQGIIENNQYSQDGSQFAGLLAEFIDNDNISLVTDERLGVNYQHAKTFLTDSKFIMQTANMTYSSFNANREIYFFSEDTGVLSSLEKIFTADWAGLGVNTADIHPNLVVCPINCRGRIESLLESAQSSITMYQQYIADNRIQDILLKKKEEGIQIMLILGDMGDKEIDPAEQRFLNAMTGTIKMQASPYVHAKAILVDKQFLLIGSMNISANSLDQNREIGILLLSPTHISTFERVFDKDWKK